MAVGDQWTCNLGFKQEGTACVDMSASERAAQLVKSLMREERVTRVMIARDEVPLAFVEWSA